MTSSQRLDDFLDGSGNLCHVDWWGAVASIWRTADAAEREDERWGGIWTRAALAPGAREALMTAEEQAAYDALPAAERERTVALLLDARGEPDLIRRP